MAQKSLKLPAHIFKWKKSKRHHGGDIVWIRFLKTKDEARLQITLRDFKVLSSKSEGWKKFKDKPYIVTLDRIVEYYHDEYDGTEESISDSYTEEKSKRLKMRQFKTKSEALNYASKLRKQY